MKIRIWQERGLLKFKEHRNKFFLAEATPGSGKTIFAGLVAKYLLQPDDETEQVDFVICVVPGVPIKGDRDKGFLGDWNKLGLDLTTTLRDGQRTRTGWRRGRTADIHSVGGEP
jgi:hypothetical protein